MRLGSDGGELRVAALLCAALWVSAGCGGGDDDHATKGDAGTAGSGGSSSSAGSGGSSAAMDAGIKPLGDDVAGKPCSSASDCSGAMCATQIAGGAILPVTAPDGYCTGACATNADCGSGGVCAGAISGITNGDCFAGCSSDDDCRDGYLCIDGVTIAGITIPNTCRPKPATDQLEDGVAGKACTAASDCAGGTCLTMRGGFMGMGGTTLPGGYCTGSCLQDSECGSGGVCSPGLLEGTAGSCYEKCSSDGDCTRDGYRCRQVGMDIRGCDPFPDPLPDGQAGKACESDTDCGGVSGTCKTSLPAGGGFGGFGRMDTAAGGYCSQTCEEDADCGLGGVCIGAGLVAGSCFKPCDDPTDCRDGYACQQREASGFPMLMQAPDAGMSTALTVCAPMPMMTEDGGM